MLTHILHSWSMLWYDSETMTIYWVTIPFVLKAHISSTLFWLETLEANGPPSKVTSKVNPRRIYCYQSTPGRKTKVLRHSASVGILQAAEDTTLHAMLIAETAHTMWVFIPESISLNNCSNLCWCAWFHSMKKKKTFWVIIYVRIFMLGN